MHRQFSTPFLPPKVMFNKPDTVIALKVNQFPLKVQLFKYKVVEYILRTVENDKIWEADKIEV